MSQYLQVFIILPLFVFVAGLLIPGRKERLLAGLVIAGILLQFSALTGFIGWWLINGAVALDHKHIVFLQTEDIEVFLDFYFDKTTAVFAWVGSLLMILVGIFSRYYLHREAGYKRFFSTLSLFFLGYCLVVFSGNFETLFMGWELIGISSFLLISFYRDRFLPVKNAFKVLSVYRLSDICLILAMWMSHQLWHENITFMQLNDTASVDAHLATHQWYGYLLAGLLVLAAAIKSAQVPFSSWLPRAMEGPTTSSAIFYASLSVHLGIFILLRTYTYWEGLFLIRVLIISIGVFTAMIATSIARVQASVKTQIAYASAAQIGLIFIEVALGWHVLALIHFAGNAFLRTYQLLVSPSVLSYRIHDMFFNFRKRGQRPAGRLTNTLYILSTKEWNMDKWMKTLLWDPFKQAGTVLSVIVKPLGVAILTTMFLAGVYIYLNEDAFPPDLYGILPVAFSLTGLLITIRSFTDRGDAKQVWLLVLAGQLFITLSIALLHDEFTHRYMFIYLSGSMVFGLVGYLCLRRIENIDEDILLDIYHGYSYEQPRAALLFLVACLGIIGMPFTPTFIGIDLLFSHIHKSEMALIAFTATSFVFMELAVIRIYAHVFLGQHKKPYHPVAFKSS